METKKLVWGVMVVALIFLLAFYGSIRLGGDDENGLVKVTVLLDWTPNTNYSGMYAASALGYYEEEGLAVEFLQSESLVPLVADGKAQFGVSYQEQVTFARVEEIPVVSIAAVIGHNTSGFASLAGRGIETPADFEGKSYGGWGSPIEEATIQALMEQYGADFEKVEILTTGTVDSLLVIEQEADFAWIYYGWTGIEAELRGMDLNFMELRLIDPVLDYYTPVLIAGESLVETDPELVRRFMRATSRGYLYAVDNPAEAADILLEAAPELDRDLVHASQEWLKGRYKGDTGKWGLQARETWESYAQWLYERGLIENMLHVDSAFTNEFLEE